MEKKKIKSVSDHCENCGAALYYSPKHNSLFCDNCESSFPIVNNNKIVPHNVISAKEKTDLYEMWKNQNKIFKCESCGSEIVLNSLEISTKCQYCGSPYVAMTDALPDLIPDAVLPFQFEEDKANELFQNKIKKNFWVPNSFRRNIPESKIYSFYLSSFVFDADSKSSYNGTLATFERTSDGQTTTSYENINGNYNMLHRNYIVEASSKVNQITIKSLFPYNLELAKPFLNEYVFGWAVEYYADGLKKSYADAINQMKQDIRSGILNKYHYDQVVSLNINSSFENEYYKYYILPVYNFSFTYKKKLYNVYMNGQSGKLGSGLPISIFKVVLVVIIFLLFIGGIIFLSMFGETIE